MTTHALASPAPNPACRACGRADAALALALDQRRLLRCHGCGLVRLDPVPTLDELSAVYDGGRYYTTEPPRPRTGLGAVLQDAVLRTFWGYPSAPRGLRRALAAVLLRPLRDRFLPVPWPGSDPVLDIGCGNGQRLLELERHGCGALTGLEPTVGAAQQARRATHADIRCTTLEDAGLPTDHFALVILNQVLEHVPSPATTLAAIRSHLRPGGQLYLTVPNFGSTEARLFGPAWEGLQVPEHLHHFTEASLRRLVEDSGLRIRLLRTDSVWSVTRASLQAWGRTRPGGWRGILARLPAQAWLPFMLAADIAGRGQMLRLVATRDDT